MQRAIDATQRNINPTAADDAATNHKQEAGYYLIANGRREFEKEIGYRGDRVAGWFAPAGEPESSVTSLGSQSFSR